MAEVTLASASEKQKWISDYFAEYVRESGFKGYMGKSNNSIIIAKYELQEEAGKTINIPLITRLKSATGVTGSAVLDGNEEELGNYNCAISVDWRRNGVRVPKSTSFKTEIDLLNAARDMLKMWEAEKVRDDIIRAMLSMNTTATRPSTSATRRPPTATLTTPATRIACSSAPRCRTTRQPGRPRWATSIRPPTSATSASSA
jgi:hypothetical protein